LARNSRRALMGVKFRHGSGFLGFGDRGGLSP
jgi:hypothetical protein